jgi:hypothetical protein
MSLKEVYQAADSCKVLALHDRSIGVEDKYNGPRLGPLPSLLTSRGLWNIERNQSI